MLGDYPATSFFILSFFFYPLSLLNGTEKKNQWIRTFPPLPRCSNIYLNVLSINITRLLLERFAEGIQFKGSYIRFARLKTANRLQCGGRAITAATPTIPNPSHRHHPPIHPPPPLLLCQPPTLCHPTLEHFSGDRALLNTKIHAVTARLQTGDASWPPHRAGPSRQPHLTNEQWENK